MSTAPANGTYRFTKYDVANGSTLIYNTIRDQNGSASISRQLSKCESLSHEGLAADANRELSVTPHAVQAAPDESRSRFLEFSQMRRA